MRSLEQQERYIASLEEQRDLLADLLGDLWDCPAETRGADLDCERRCKVGIGYGNCWRLWAKEEVCKSN